MTPLLLDNKKNSGQGGYVLLLSVIFLGAIAVTVAGSLLLLGLSRSQTGFTLQQSSQARALSEACVETALNNLEADSTYTGNETITLNNNDVCQILPITFGDPIYNIQTQAIIGPITKTTIIKAELQTDPTTSSTIAHIDSWK